MNNDSVKPRNRLLFFALVVLLTIPLTLLLWNVARDVILVPLLYVLWVGRIIFRAIPQLLLWIVFLTIALLFALGSLTKHKQPAREIRDESVPNPGQVWVWARRIYLMERRSFSRWYFAQHLHQLILKVLAHRERVEIRQIKQHLQTGELDVPPEIRAYLWIALARTYTRPTFWSRLRRRLPLGTQSIAPDLDLEDVVQFLEEQLDIELGDQI